VSATIVDWLQHDREPADLYELLGEARFEPSRRRLLAAAHACYRALLPYESHTDPRVAGKATGLLRRLASADGILRDPAKLRAQHRAILDSLRAAYAQAGGDRFTSAELADWLRQQSIHPDRIGIVARMLAAPREETQSFSLAATQHSVPLSPGEPAEDFFLEELEPSQEELHKLPPWEVPKGTAHARESVLAEAVFPEPERQPPSQAPRVVDGPVKPRPFGRRRPRRALPQLGWIALASVSGAILLGIVVVVLLTGGEETWQGVVLQVRGQAGETHALLQLAGQARLEAVTRNSRVARALDDCWSVEELQEMQSAQGGARNMEATGAAGEVLIRGRRYSGRAPTFRLDARPDVPLVEALSIVKPRRAAAGRSLAPGRLTELAQLLRVHPPAGATASFPARYGTAQPQSITVFPSATDRRPVVLEFPGTSPTDFANYRVDDAVLVRAVVLPQTSPARPVLRGVEIRRLAEPVSRVAAKGGSP